MRSDEIGAEVDVVKRLGAAVGHQHFVGQRRVQHAARQAQGARLDRQRRPGGGQRRFGDARGRASAAPTRGGSISGRASSAPAAAPETALPPAPARPVAPPRASSQPGTPSLSAGRRRAGAAAMPSAARARQSGRVVRRGGTGVARRVSDRGGFLRVGAAGGVKRGGSELLLGGATGRGVGVAAGRGAGGWASARVSRAGSGSGSASRGRVRIGASGSTGPWTSVGVGVGVGRRNPPGASCARERCAGDARARSGWCGRVVSWLPSAPFKRRRR